MPDDKQPQTPPPAGQTPPPAPSADKKDDKGDAQTPPPAQDSDDLTPEQWEKAFKSKRFKELNEAAKKAAKLEADAKAKEEAALAEQGKWKELAEKREAELTQEREGRMKTTKEIGLLKEASGLGIVDSKVALALIDWSKVEVDEQGVVTNGKAILESLVAEHPILVGKTTPPANIGAGKSPADKSAPNGKKMWKWSEIRTTSKNQAEYEKNKEEFDLARKEGRVDYSQ